MTISGNPFIDFLFFMIGLVIVFRVGPWVAGIDEKELDKPEETLI